MAGEVMDPNPKRSRRMAWEGVCPFPVGGRVGKPRENGLTMVIDKGMGVAQTADMLDVSGEHVDLLKLAFGTTAFYPEETLRRKIQTAVAHDVAVYPGGTFLEVAGKRTSCGCSTIPCREGASRTVPRPRSRQGESGVRLASSRFPGRRPIGAGSVGSLWLQVRRRAPRTWAVSARRGELGAHRR